MPDTSKPNSVSSSGDRGRGEIGDVPDAIARRYYHDDRGGPGRSFYVDAVVERPAFRDRGKVLTTDRVDPNAIRDMVSIARHRGWRGVAVQGEQPFRREAWLEARVLGLEVSGYRPTERDLQALTRREDHAARRQTDRSEIRERTTGEQTKGLSGAAERLAVVRAVVGARVANSDSQARILQAARERVAQWLERGADFGPLREARPRRTNERETGRERHR